MEQEHLEQLAIWIADQLVPVDKADMPLIFKDEALQDRLWREVCKLLHYKN